MRSEFRFPKATPILMAIILAGVILTIEKATAIEESLPHAYPQQLPRSTRSTSHFSRRWL